MRAYFFEKRLIRTFEKVKVGKYHIIEKDDNCIIATDNSKVTYLLYGLVSLTIALILWNSIETVYSQTFIEKSTSMAGLLTFPFVLFGLRFIIEGKRQYFKIDFTNETLTIGKFNTIPFDEIKGFEFRMDRDNPVSLIADKISNPLSIVLKSGKKRVLVSTGLTSDIYNLAQLISERTKLPLLN